MTPAPPSLNPYLSLSLSLSLSVQHKSEAMKQNFQGFLIFLLFAFLLFSYSTSARLLAPKHGEKELKANGISHPGSFIEITDLSNLMGSEDCEDKDEECLKRRMMADAHLDYIYTQHHKP